MLAIERDAMDPHLLANLTKLGPVRVDHHMQGYRLVRGGLAPQALILLSIY